MSCKNIVFEEIFIKPYFILVKHCLNLISTACYRMLPSIQYMIILNNPSHLGQSMMLLGRHFKTSNGQSFSRTRSVFREVVEEL